MKVKRYNENVTINRQLIIKSNRTAHLIIMNFIFTRNLLLNKKSSNSFVKTVFRSITAVDQPHKSDKNNNNNNDGSNRNKKTIFAAIGATLVLGAYKYYDSRKQYVCAAAAKNAITISENNCGTFRSDLPTFTMNEVSSHNSKENKIWVIYKQGVYDVTEFVASHPGGDNILLAAGSSVEPFWMIYGIHKTDQVYKMMEEMRIGNITKDDAGGVTGNMDDPYVNDPRRHPVLRPASKKPFNAEPVPHLLVESFITPNDLFYVRNHLPVPVVDPKTYELEIEIEGKTKTISLTLDELKKFKKYTVTASIMCAGNRRSEMSKVKQVKGLNWGHAVIGNATWSGARLRDVLKSVGITGDEDFKHVQFEGLDVDVVNNPYGGSIPFFKAMDEHGDVLLAYEMNDEPLPRDHGYPVRVVVPGTVGARNVKWLGKIVVSHAESPAFWQQNDYKGFNPSVEMSTADFSKAQSIQQLPVISAICMPENGNTVTLNNGAISVKGYAWSGGGQKIYRVDVTADGGKTWHVANIDVQGAEEPPQHWGWTLWSANIPVDPKTKTVEIWAKAVDSSYNTQPETFENIWNIRGVLSNAYHRVTVYINQAK